MSYIADVATVGTAIFLAGFSVWVTVQLLKKAD